MKRSLHPEVLALYRERINERLAGVSHCEQIGQFTLFGADLPSSTTS